MSLSDRTIYIFTPEGFKVVGTPTITDDGIASGFSDNNYIKHVASTPISLGSLEVKIKLRTGETLRPLSSIIQIGTAPISNTILQVLTNSNGSIGLGFHNGGTWQGAYSSRDLIKPQSDYDILIYCRNNKIILELSENGSAYDKVIQKDIVVDKLESTDIFIGAIQQPNNYFLGSIDLKALSISVDGKEVFSGSRKIEIGAPVLDDSEHLPKVVTNVLGIDDILLAIDPEVQLLRVDISDLIKELYVKTTDKFIRRWENDFSLPYDSSLTLQQRRQRVLNKLARKKTLTWENLKLLIRNNIDNPQFYIMNDSENYHFTIMVQTPNYNELTKALDETIPAYLTYDIIVTEYFKRCGTFVSGTNPL